MSVRYNYSSVSSIEMVTIISDISGGFHDY